ncbi:hypothetical protein Xoosp13_155 [Xanthomonas phage Xoo-sp13]|nr:hypothetical protein Xoosp13_155 [Xanthomonas phage Xoo-sp13]
MFRINHTIFCKALVDKTNDIDELELESLLQEFYDDYMGEDAYGELIRNSILNDSLTPAELQRMTPW